MRKAKYAGLFYESSESNLTKQIEQCFIGDKGPGVLPLKKKSNSHLKAVIVPHAGYIYSGACAAWAYKEIAEHALPDLFVIIGPSHHYGISGLSLENFETALGIVRINQEFGRKLAEKGTIKQNELIHENEHSLEVQIPFLQYIFKKNIEKLKILPILVSEDIDLKKLALDIKETIIDTDLKVSFIVSSDFTHYGSKFNFTPFKENIKQNLLVLDSQAIDFIKKLDSEGFISYIRKTRATICGYLPIYLLLNLINSKKINLEQYYTSGDLTNDYDTSVSYASIIFN